jgi:DNA-binding MarR family transcriptional regulator
METALHSTGNESGKDDLVNLLSYRLSVVANLMSRSQLMRFAPIAGVSLPEWRVLVLVNSYGPLSVKSLSRRAGLDFGQTSRLVSRMADGGFIVKRPTDDARSVDLLLTAQGKALHRRLWKVAMQSNTDFLANLSTEERKVLLSALDKLTSKAKSSMEAHLERPNTHDRVTEIRKKFR